MDLTLGTEVEEIALVDCLTVNFLMMLLISSLICSVGYLGGTVVLTPTVDF